ncbi:MAG: DUF5995 family protein [Bacteroidales bacterium]|nr:DUF5995 family protein [Bacteroidales bacterium]
MNSNHLNSIDDVISILDDIILETEMNNNPLGYFAVLYRKVTVKVKEGIENQFFDDGPRMEKLDIIFARYYIDAYFAWKQNQTVSQSWEKAFFISENKSMLVLQHLLMGMNAHINLDLGIAAAEISTRENIHQLKNDFIKINDILSSQVDEVQFGLSAIWAPLKKILSKTGQVDNYLVDFSMKIARDGAWNFATEIVQFKETGWQNLIQTRDFKVSEKSKLITHSNKWIQFLLWIIRLGERGSVSEKINKLKEYNPTPFKKS